MDGYVFISHSATDKAIADAICARLEEAGIRCWMAPRDITPGRMWGEAIIDAINASRLMVLVFSRHSNKSPQVVREVERAVNRGLPLLQIRVEDVRPSRMLEFFVSTSHWLDAFPPPVERHLAGLPAAVERLLAESMPTDEQPIEPVAVEPEPANVEEPPAEEPPAEEPPAEEPPPVPRVEPPRVEPPRVEPPRVAWRGARVASLALGATVAGVVGFQAIRSWAAASRSERGPAGGDAPRLVLRIAPTDSTRQAGDTFALRVAAPNAGDSAPAAVRWRSGDSAVVRVGPGDTLFRAVAPGAAFLYAEAGALRDSVRVRVVARVAVAPPGDDPKRPGNVPVPPVPGGRPNGGNVKAPAPKGNAGRPTSGTTGGASSGTTSGTTPSPKGDVPPVVSDPAPPRPTPPDRAALPTVAQPCVDALKRKDLQWLTSHDGGAGTVADQESRRALTNLLGKRGYQAELLADPRVAGDGVEFTMRFKYASNFGPSITTNGEFRVEAAARSGRWELERCRVRGTLRVP